MTVDKQDWEVQLKFADMSADPAEAFAQVFPLNPCRKGRMVSYDHSTGIKESETIKEPVTLDDVRRNMCLKGHASRLGFLPGDQDSTSVGMIDIDLKSYRTPDDMRKVVDDVTAVLKRAQFPCYEETSTNGGAHLWIFLSEKVPYQLMTDVLKVLKAEANQSKVETYPGGSKDVKGRWAYMPYAGAQNDEAGLGITYLRDAEHGWEIPAWALAQAVQRVSVDSFLAVLARKPREAQQEAKQKAAHDLALDGYELLVAATLKPPAKFARHESVEAFLNLAERMGKQDEMAAHLKSETVYAMWITDGSRSREAWAAEIDRWIAVESDRQYGISFLAEQGWQIPNLPKLNARGTDSRGKQGWQQAFETLRSKYVKHEQGVSHTQRIRRYRAHEVGNIPQLESLVGNLLVQRTLAALLGPSGAGKSMIGMDVALHVATGRDWHGQTVAEGPVVWLAAESMEYTAKRMEAWCNRHGVNPECLPFDILDGYLALTDVDSDGGLEELILFLKDIEAERGELRLIVVDTVARTFGDGDENSNDDMKHFTDAAEMLTRIFNATVLLVHHTGKDTSRGGRGASAFKAPLTTELIVEKESGYVALSQSKNRGSAEHVKPLRLRFETHSWEVNGVQHEAGVVAEGDVTDGLQIGIDLLIGERKRVHDILTALSLRENDQLDWVPRSEWRDKYREEGGNVKTFNYELTKLLNSKLIEKQAVGKNETYRPSREAVNE